MKFILKIKSNFNSIIQFNEKTNIEITENNFITVSIDLSENQTSCINVEPNLNSGLVFPYKIYLKNINNKLEIISENVNVFTYRNIYLITLNKFEAIKDMSVLLNDSKFSVYNTYCTNITIKNGTLKLNELYEKISTKKINNNIIIMLENNNKKYVVILFNDELIFKDFYNEIKLTSKIEIFSKLNDITKHAIITSIENQNITKKIVYYNNTPKLIKNDKIIPLAFIQALKIENIKLCKHYLSSDLKSVSNLDNLKFYFGDFIKVEPIVNENALVLFYEDKSHKIFKFSILEHKINKIETI